MSKKYFNYLMILADLVYQEQRNTFSASLPYSLRFYLRHRKIFVSFTCNHISFFTGVFNEQHIF